MSSSSSSRAALSAACGPPPSVDTTMVTDHIRWLHELAAGVDGDLVLSCNEQSLVDEKPGVQTFRFAVGDHEGMARVALDQACRPWTNVFFSSYVARSGGTGRGGREDVVAVLILGIDQDADTGRSGRVPLLPASMIIRTSSKPQINRQTFFAFDPAHRPSVDEVDKLGRRLRAFCQEGIPAPATSTACFGCRAPGTGPLQQNSRGGGPSRRRSASSSRTSTVTLRPQR